MAERYVTAGAGGGGNGTSGSPWTWAEMITKLNDSTIDNGDRVNVKTDATYTGIADFAITRGADDESWITIQGYTTNIGDGGRPTIQRKAAEVGHWCDVVLAVYYHFKDLIFDGNSEGDGTGYTFQDDSEAIYENMTVKNGADNYQIRGHGGKWYNSDCDNAGLNGTYAGYWFNCIIQDSGGINIQYTHLICNSIVKGEGSHGGFRVVNAINTVFDDSGASANPVYQRGSNTIYHCIIVNAPTGRYGLWGDYGREMIVNCGFYNNAGGNYNSKVRALGTQVTTDPQFNNPGALDYTRTGTNYDSKGFDEIGMVSGVDYNMDIGPYQKAAGGAVTTAVGVIGG